MSESSEKNPDEEEINNENNKSKQEFKKPTDLLANKKHKRPSSSSSSHSHKKSKMGPSPAEHISHHSIPLPYKEPEWGGISEGNYNFDVLKSGKIIENLVVKSKSFYTFGRQGNCDFPMLNPTISRYHAIFQFRKDPLTEAGFYLFDLGSTHGTFLNKKKIPPNTYVRMRVGHILKLGLSTRYFILNGPEEDMDLEYDGHRHLRQLDDTLEEEDEKEKEPTEKTKKKVDDGIDWGMGEDADEETDLTENPYAATNNEELYLDDPKKTLKGWFEREGYELEYNIEEKGPGHFACTIELPIDVSGIKRAEAIVKGKKNHAKIQCALEACRILDRYGLLRVSNHASLKVKPKKWEDDDFYDSDEDSFLDRTGTIEKKRHQRMKAAGKLEEKVETYASLVEKHKIVVAEIKRLETELSQLTLSKNSKENSEDQDELEAFMDDLQYSVSDKNTIKKINNKLIELKKEQSLYEHMMTLSKPAEMPSLKTSTQSDEHNSRENNSKTPLFGQRKNLLKKKYESKNKPENASESNGSSGENEKESKSEELEEDKNSNESNIDKTKDENKDQINDNDKENSSVENKNMEEERILENSNKEIKDGDENSKKVHEKNNDEKMDNPFKDEDAPNEIEKEESNNEEIMNQQDIEDKQKEEESLEETLKEEPTVNEGKSSEQEAKITKYEDPPEYTDWLPPSDQTGDGKTSLNEKFGY